MKALFKTLFGDARNIAVIALVVALDLAAAALGWPRAAALATPVLLLLAIGWLASR